MREDGTVISQIKSGEDQKVETKGRNMFKSCQNPAYISARFVKLAQ